jgi:hypothetical protein
MGSRQLSLPNSRGDHLEVSMLVTDTLTSVSLPDGQPSLNALAGTDTIGAGQQEVALLPSSQVV